MNKIYIAILAIGFLASCNNQTANETSEKQEVSTNADGINYTIDSASAINWEAFKVVGNGHVGSVNLSNGSFVVNNGNIVSGSFEIDMNSITNSDLDDAKSNSNLVAHLKGIQTETANDFFNVTKYPTAKFEVTACEAITGDANGNTHKVSGNFTIKDSVKNISFPVKVTAEGDVLTVSGDVTLNRLNFGITYNSPTATPADVLKKLSENYLIKDEFKLTFNLKASK